MTAVDVPRVEVSSGAADRFPATAALIDECVGGGSALGVRVEIVHRSGERFHLTGAHPGLGYRLIGETTYRWFCAIKTALAMTVLTLLRAEGAGADVPVHRLLPAFSGDGRDAVTVEHLLMHTSGLPSFPVADGRSDLVSAALATPLPAGRVPGAATAYNICTAWTLIAAVIETLGGRPVGTAVDDLVFAPAGLTDTVLAVRSADDRRLAARVARLVSVGSAPRRHITMTSPAVLAGLPAWIGGLGTLSDLAGLFAHLLRVRGGGGSADEREVAMDVTARSAQRRYDSTLGRPVAYARGTMVDVSTAGFGRGWSADSFGVGGSIDRTVVIGAWADPRRDIACAVALPGVGPLNSTQMFRISEQIRVDVDGAASPAAPR